MIRQIEWIFIQRQRATTVRMSSDLEDKSWWSAVVVKPLRAVETQSIASTQLQTGRWSGDRRCSCRDYVVLKCVLYLCSHWWVTRLMWSDADSLHVKDLPRVFARDIREGKWWCYILFPLLVYDRKHSVTTMMLMDLRIPTLSTILHNATFKFRERLFDHVNSVAHYVHYVCSAVLLS